MAAVINEGDQVKVVAPTIEGPVLDTRWNKDARQLEHLVEWDDNGDEEGGKHTRWFLASELEVTKAAEGGAQ
jgi:hypothetical protein